MRSVDGNVKTAKVNVKLFFLKQAKPIKIFFIHFGRVLVLINGVQVSFELKQIPVPRIRRTHHFCLFVILPALFHGAGLLLDGAETRGRRVKGFWCSHFARS